jgi:hypothetical protein
MMGYKKQTIKAGDDKNYPSCGQTVSGLINFS